MVRRGSSTETELRFKLANSFNIKLHLRHWLPVGWVEFTVRKNSPRQVFSACPNQEGDAEELCF